ncbi:MAG: signal peptidase I [Spirochaetia bacterium]|nr:signal peptidase I [Spirochaetia bacterium]
MGKYYKFPRRYYNRNKVRKPLKPKHVLQLVLLSLLFYFLCSALFIGTYRAGSDSMNPWCSSQDTLVGLRSWCTRLERGDVVLSTPTFYRTAPIWLRALDSAVQVCTFRILGLAEFFGYDTGYTAKRIVGLPGDIVKIVDSQAYIQIQGTSFFLPESDLGFTGKIIPSDVDMLKNVPPVKVEEGCYYLLSDNRNFLSDSRSMGTVEKKRIHAKVIYRLKGIGKQ